MLKTPSAVILQHFELNNCRFAFHLTQNKAFLLQNVTIKELAKIPTAIWVGMMFLPNNKLLIVVLLSYVLLVFSQFAFADVGKSIVLVVLREVETDLFAEG